MSRGSPRNIDGRQARRKSDADCESDSGDEHIAHIEFWIPSSRVDLVVLEAYLRNYVDDTATIKATQNPDNREQAGYLIGARRSLSVAQLQEIVRDSQAWEEERSTSEYRDQPYSFRESDVWRGRKDKGATAMRVGSRPRTPRSPHSDR